MIAKIIPKKTFFLDSFIKLQNRLLKILLLFLPNTYKRKADIPITNGGSDYWCTSTGNRSDLHSSGGQQYNTKCSYKHNNCYDFLILVMNVCIKN